MASAGLSHAEAIPQDAARLLEKHARAEAKLSATLTSELEKLKIKYTKRGDLDSANAINKLLKDPSKERGKPNLPDQLDNTKWTFLGINRQDINEFEFLSDGKVKCKNTYKNATWKRIDKDTIIFSYGLAGSPQIVFHINGAARKDMTGYNSENGRIRHLKLIK